MFFEVSQSNFPPSSARSKGILIPDKWDDWFKFNTQYQLIIFDNQGIQSEIGLLKIGQFGMEPGQRRPNLPHAFEMLDPNFFSLGQDISYYEMLNKLDGNMRESILIGLRDIAFDEKIFISALSEEVTQTSLLRNLPLNTVREQFVRVARGGEALTAYELHYKILGNEHKPQHIIEFDVIPESNPPTNIHVIIGRNGVGKTYLLDKIAHAIINPDWENLSHGFFLGSESRIKNTITNLVTVSFSAFDPFNPLDTNDSSEHIKVSYIGLKKKLLHENQNKFTLKELDDFSSEFRNSCAFCLQKNRINRWRKALKTLESDPVFQANEITSLLSDDDTPNILSNIFHGLSAGHKIVLFTITKLVEKVNEKTLVLFDEPESHLHPPLLSAFIRALSELLYDRNGLAILATHSPVILQEVPSNCVWKIRRSGNQILTERPLIETFGESIGTLTSEVFGLEITEAGFHHLLDDAVTKGGSYEKILEDFGGKLGGEGRALVRALIAERDAREEEKPNDQA